MARIAQGAKSLATSITSKLTSSTPVPKDDITQALTTYSDFHSEVRALTARLTKVTEDIANIHTTLMDKLLLICPTSDPRTNQITFLRDAMSGFGRLRDVTAARLKTVDNRSNEILNSLGHLASKFKAKEAAAVKEQHYEKKLEQLRNKRVQLATSTQSAINKITRNETKYAQARHESHRLAEEARTEAIAQIQRELTEGVQSVSGVLNASFTYLQSASQIASQFTTPLQQLENAANVSSQRTASYITTAQSSTLQPGGFPPLTCGLSSTYTIFQRPLQVSWDPMKLSISSISAPTQNITKQPAASLPNFPENPPDTKTSSTLTAGAPAFPTGVSSSSNFTSSLTPNVPSGLWSSSTKAFPDSCPPTTTINPTSSSSLLYNFIPSAPIPSVRNPPIYPTPLVRPLAAFPQVTAQPFYPSVQKALPATPVKQTKMSTNIQSMITRAGFRSKKTITPAFPEDGPPIDQKVDSQVASKQVHQQIEKFDKRSELNTEASRQSFNSNPSMGPTKSARQIIQRRDSYERSSESDSAYAQILHRDSDSESSEMPSPALSQRGQKQPIKRRSVSIGNIAGGTFWDRFYEGKSL